MSHRCFLQQILRNAVSKTYNRISDLRKEIQSLKKGLQVAKQASTNAMKELEEAKSVLEIVEGQPVPAERPGRLRRLQAYADKAKQEEVAMEESLEAKGALLARALEESKVHCDFIVIYTVSSLSLYLSLSLSLSLHPPMHILLIFCGIHHRVE
jgi:TolA-binding protein